MRIKVQSIVDLITNSSTETFVVLSDNAKTIITDIVDSLLAAGGSKYHFSDLFIYSEEYDDTWRDLYYEYIRAFVASIGGPSKSLFDFYENLPSETSSMVMNLIFDKVTELAILDGAFTYNEFCDRKMEDLYDGRYARKEFVIKAKEGIENDAANIAAQALMNLQILYSADYENY